jgi:hypothetical protein
MYLDYSWVLKQDSIGNFLPPCVGIAPRVNA